MNIYADVLEGTPEMTTKMQRRFLAEKSNELVWNVKATLVIDDQRSVLPQYRYIAHFRSSPTKPNHHRSDLAACWFSENINVNLRDKAKQILDSLDWDTHAENTHVDNL